MANQRERKRLMKTAAAFMIVLLLLYPAAPASAHDPGNPAPGPAGLSEAKLEDGLESEQIVEQSKPSRPFLRPGLAELREKAKLADHAMRILPDKVNGASPSGEDLVVIASRGDYLLLEKAWVETIAPDFAVVGGTHRGATINGQEWVAVRLVNGAARLAAFDPDRRGQFTRGSPNSIWIDRPMFVNVTEVPHDEIRNVTRFENGTQRVVQEIAKYRNLVIDFTSDDTSGQPVMIAKSFLARHSLFRVKATGEDGSRIPVREDSTRFILAPQHFSAIVISDDYETSTWTYSESGGSSFQTYASGGIQTFAKHSGSKSGYQEYDGGNTDGTDFGNAYLWRNWSVSTGQKLNQLAFWYNVHNYSHNGNTWDRMKAATIIELYQGNTFLSSYTYILSAWYQASDNWTGSLGSNEKLIQGKPPLNTWLKFEARPNEDWSITWTNVDKVQIKFWLYGSGTNADNIHWSFDDLVLGVDSSLLTLQYNGVLYQGKETEQFRFDIPAKAKYIEAQLTMPSGANYDLSIWDASGRRTGGLTSVNATSDNSIVGGSYGGTSVTPEWFVDIPSVTGYWKVMAYSVSGEGVYALKVRIYLDDPITSTGTDESWHSKFDLSTRIYSVDATLRMPTGTNFDLTLWETDLDANARIGGNTSSDHNGYRNTTPNAVYSGVNANPEWIHLAALPSTGDYWVSVHSMTGGNGYAVELQIEADWDADGLSDRYEHSTIYKLSFGPEPETADLALPKKPKYANESYEMRGYGHFMSASASTAIRRNSSSVVAPVDAKVGYWINRTDSWNFTSNTSGWTALTGTWAWKNDAGEGMYEQSDTSLGNTNSYASVIQVGKASYDYKCKFISGGWTSCGMHFFADSTVTYERGNSYIVWQDPQAVRIYEGISNVLWERNVNWSATAANGQTHTYRVDYDSATGTIKAYRNGGTYPVVQWTDSSPLKEGKYISLRTNSAKVYFDNVTARVEGWRERDVVIPSSGGTGGYLAVSKNLITLGFEKERFMESNVWRVRIAKDSWETVTLDYFTGDLNVTSDVFVADSDYDGLVDGAEQKNEYLWGKAKTIEFSVPVTGKYRVNATVTAGGTPLPWIDHWLDYDTSGRRFVWSGTATSGTFNLPTTLVQLTRGVHTLTLINAGGTISNPYQAAKKELVDVSQTAKKCSECYVDVRASPVTPDSENDAVLDGIEWYEYEYLDSREPWLLASPAKSPKGRYLAMSAYDSSRDRTVLFGGYDGGYLSDTWAYDHEASSWTEMTPASGPSARYAATMAYSTRADRFVLYGGRTSTATNSETWVYNLGDNTWTNQNPAAPPSARFRTAMVYDSKSDRFVLFGGCLVGDSSGCNLGQYSQVTWAYDLANNTWTNKNPSSPPSLRYGHAMAYDLESDRVVLFGGYLSTSAYDQQTWAYDVDGNTWTNKNPAGSKPSARRHHAMAYDVIQDRTVLFGGFTGSSSDQTWTYDLNGNAWTQKSPPTKPSARYGSMMSYDGQSKRSVLFGGYTGSYDAQTWAYDLAAGETTYSVPYSKLISLAGGLYNVTIRVQASTGTPDVNITLDNATLDQRNVTAGAVYAGFFRASIGGGSHWLQIKGTSISSVKSIRFEKLLTDPEKQDTEGDGLKDDEPYVHGTLPTSKDTDLDGLWDGREVAGQNATVNGQTTRVDSSPVLADTDSDGLPDNGEWGTQLNETFAAPSSSWTQFGSSGKWSWGKDGSNGVYKFTGNTISNTNAWTELIQGGATTYEWRAKMTSGTNSARGFGVVFYASDSASTDRGTNYYVWQTPSTLSINDCSTNVGTGASSCSSVSSSGQASWNNVWYRYKATYNPANSTVNVWRNGTLYLTWADTGSPAMTGAHVSLRTNLADATYDYVYANRTASNPKSNDTDADGLYDWHDLSGWVPVNGTWEWRDGVYQQTQASGAPLTNSYAPVAQSGEMTYEWRMKFVGSFTGAGMHVFASSGTQANHENSYMVMQTGSKVQIYKSTANVLSFKTEVTKSAVTNTWYKYKVVYTPSNYSVNVWRNASWVGKWTDSSSAALQAGSAISLKTNASSVKFDDVYANASGSNVAKWPSYIGWAERPSGSFAYNNDSDGDQLDDLMEVRGWPINIWLSGLKTWRNVTASPVDATSDSDGWDDKKELNGGTDPKDNDTDDDAPGCGQSTCGNDNVDTTPFGSNDLDTDGLADAIELAGWTIRVKYPTSGGGSTAKWVNSTVGPKDSDGDGLWDYSEYSKYLSEVSMNGGSGRWCQDNLGYCYGTDPRDNDTDDDGWNDGGNLVINIVIERFEAIDDGDWFSKGDIYLAVAFEELGLRWRIPEDPREVKVFTVDSSTSQNWVDILELYSFAANSSWDRKIKFTNFDLDPWGFENLGSLEYEFVATSTPSTTNKTFSVSNNRLRISQSAWVMAESFPSDARGDDDADAVNDVNESFAHTIPVGGQRDIFLAVNWINEDQRMTEWRMSALSVATTTFMERGIYLHALDNRFYDGQWWPYVERISLPMNGGINGQNDRPAGEWDDYFDFKWGGDNNHNGVLDGGETGHAGSLIWAPSEWHVLHYVLFAWKGDGLDADANGKADGTVPEPGGDDLVVFTVTAADGCWISKHKCVASTLIHEIGHNLGLLHYSSESTYSYSGRSAMLSGSGHLRFTEGEWNLINLRMILVRGTED